MLLLQQNLAASGGSGTISYSFTGTPASQSPGFTGAATFTGMAIGTAAADRRVVAYINTLTISGEGSNFAVTIGGVSATIHYVFNSTASNYGIIASAIVPTGTTATVVFSDAVNPNNINTVDCCVAAMTGVDATTPVASTAVSSLGFSSTSLGPITVPSGGLAAILSQGSGTSYTMSGTGVTTDAQFTGVSANPVYAHASSSFTATLSDGSGAGSVIGCVVFNPAAASGVTLTPTDGSVAATGQSSTLTTSLNPATGSLAATGQSAGLVRGLNPATGSAAASGISPALTTFLNPATGSATATGQAAVFALGLNPATGSLAATGQAATTTLGLNPSTGSLAATGQSAGLVRGLNPATGAVASTGQTPALTTATNPASGSVAATGQTPTLSSTSGVDPATGAVTSAGQTPALTTFLNPATGSLTASGQQPVGAAGGTGGSSIGLLLALTTASGVNIYPAAGALAATGQQPVVVVSTTSVSPLTGSVTLTGQQPTFSGSGANVGTPLGMLLAITGSSAIGGVLPQAGAVTVTGQQPIVRLTTTLTPSTGSVTIGGQQPSLVAPGQTSGQSVGLLLAITTTSAVSGLQPATRAVTITGQQPTINGAATTITTGTQSVTITGQQPVVTVSGFSAGTPVGLLLAITAPLAGGNQSVNLFPQSGSLTVTRQPVVLVTTVRPATRAVSVSGQQPVVGSNGVNVSPATGSASFSGWSPVVTSGNDITPHSGVLTFHGNKPKVTGQYKLKREQHRIRRVS